MIRWNEAPLPRIDEAAQLASLQSDMDTQQTEKRLPVLITLITEKFLNFR